MNMITGNTLYARFNAGRLLLVLCFAAAGFLAVQTCHAQQNIRISTGLLEEYWKAGLPGAHSRQSGFSLLHPEVRAEKSPSFSEDLQRRHFWLGLENASGIIADQVRRGGCSPEGLAFWWAPGGAQAVDRKGSNIFLNALWVGDKDETYPFVLGALAAAECLSGQAVPELPTSTGRREELVVAEVFSLLHEAYRQSLQGALIGDQFRKGTEAWKVRKAWDKPLKKPGSEAFTFFSGKENRDHLVAHLSRTFSGEPMPAGLQEQVELFLLKISDIENQYEKDFSGFSEEVVHAKEKYLQPVEQWQPVLLEAEEKLVDGAGWSALSTILALADQYPGEPEIAVRLAAMYLFLDQETPAVNWLEAAFRSGFRNWERLNSAPFDRLADHPGLGYLRKRYPRY